MNNIQRLFNTSNDLQHIAYELPSPYIDYVIQELERLYKFADKKLEQIMKREKEKEKNV